MLLRFLGKILSVKLPATFRRDGRENLSDLIYEKYWDKCRPALVAAVKWHVKYRVVREITYRGWRFQHITKQGSEYFQTFSAMFPDTVFNEYEVFDMSTISPETAAKIVVEYVDLEDYAKVWCKAFRGSDGPYLESVLRAGQSIDGVPWEIHLIDDEDAYQVALQAYLDERDHC